MGSGRLEQRKTSTARKYQGLAGASQIGGAQSKTYAHKNGQLASRLVDTIFFPYLIDL